jgi:hypothetical protein
MKGLIMGHERVVSTILTEAEHEQSLDNDRVEQSTTQASCLLLFHHQLSIVCIEKAR